MTAPSSPAPVPSAEAAPQASVPAPGRSRARAVVQLGVSLGLTGLLGAWAFRGVRWPEVWQSLLAARWGWLLPHLALLTLVHMLRAVRFGLLLSRMGRLSFRHLNEVLAVGNMLLTLLPLRLGELARPMMVARRSPIPASAALASVTLERVLDGIALAVLLEAVLPLVPAGAPGLASLRWVAHALLAGFSGLLFVLLLAGRAERQVLGLLRAVLGRLAPRLAEPVVGRVEGFVRAMRLLPRGGALLGVLVLTAAGWLGYALANWALVPAFACGAGCAPLEVGLKESLVVLALTSVGGFIPAAPGQAGTFQAAVRFSLALFVSEAVLSGTGLVYANVLWLTGVLYQVLLGALFMAVGAVSLREVGLGGTAVAPETVSTPAAA